MRAFSVATLTFFHEDGESREKSISRTPGHTACPEIIRGMIQAGYPIMMEQDCSK
jgi:hypothetical protein